MPKASIWRRYHEDLATLPDDRVSYASACLISHSMNFAIHRLPLLLISTLLNAAVVVTSAGEPLSFNEVIRPILSDNCFACHGIDEKHRKADLRLDTAEGAYAENDGRAIVPGDPAKSEAWLRIISDDPEEVMPTPKSHKPPLKAEQRALIKRWIEEGAKYEKHWAFEPLPNADSAVSIDHFIGERLAKAGLQPAPQAEKATLLRRLTLDLTGLPPSFAELDAFLADPALDAYERAVKRLLQSPHYGEHMARPWLDAVRYADTHGMHFDNMRSVWPYRDWVVRAFNENLAFDQFTIAQLAGDLLPNPTRDQLIASGYNRHQLSSHEGGSITAELYARYTADRTDTTAAVWLGLTANCASCHDHKFDPLTQKEYYQLSAFFSGLADSAWDGNLPLPGPRVLLTSPAQQQRLDFVTAKLAELQPDLNKRATQLAAAVPLPKNREPVTYEVVFAEDGTLPGAGDLANLPAENEWREGADVPLVGGRRALRMDGAGVRSIPFSYSDLQLAMSRGLRVFAHWQSVPDRAPKAVGLELISPKKTQRVVWGDAKALGAGFKDAILAGPMPLPGTYARLEFDAAAAGLKADDVYSGLRLHMSDGAGWLDRAGAVITSRPDQDPLLSMNVWVKNVREKVSFPNSQLPLDVQHLMTLMYSDPTPEEKQAGEAFFSTYIFGPTRAALEADVTPARRLMAEQVAIEKSVDGSIIARESPKPRPAHVLLRGQYDQHGEAVQPATPAFLPALHKAGERATRLDLARWLVSRENPLTARVTVNRFWQQFFGAGLVRTPGDFGAQGESPTHRALLDWLAADFVDHGWDVKRLVQQIVTSHTYRQSARTTPAQLETDPANRLLARAPRLRLDAEVLRDQALAISGLLHPALGGPPVRPYQPDNVWEPVAFAGSNTRRYQQDSGSALYRRSLYTFWKRTAPPVSLATFDAPARESFCVARQRTNTPLQALALMNDVQQFETARVFAERLITEGGTDSTRLASAFRAVTAREPSDAERILLVEALAAQRARFAQDEAEARKAIAVGESRSSPNLEPRELAAWTLVANLLLNLDETINRN